MWGEFLYAKAAEWGNPPNRDNQITVRARKTHGRTTATSVASYFDDFTSKTTKTLIKLTVRKTIKAWNLIAWLIGIKLKFS